MKIIKHRNDYQLIIKNKLISGERLFSKLLSNGKYSCYLCR